MGTILRKIRESDLEQIMRWRMSEEITKYMNTNPKLTIEGQRKWLSSIEDNTDVLYRMIEVDGLKAGVINLTKLTNYDGNIGWAYYVGEKKVRGMRLALSLEMSMYDYAFGILKKNSVCSDVFTLNKGVITLHKMCGCDIIEEKKSAILKEGIYYDVTYMLMTAEKWCKIKDTKKYEKIEW
jgi:RimJ/RimL family protein N-acetyltransferase